MKRARKIHWNTFVILSALIFCAGVYANIRVGKLPRTSLKQVDPLLAQSACDTSFFTVQSPSGKSFGKSCIVNGGQMYAGDARYTFFLPASAVDHVAYVQTGNADIKDSTSLPWSITTQRAATIYLITRHIPNFPQVPAWISQNYTRQTNDDLSHIDQYFKRKNDQGLLGLYDVFSRNVGAGTVQLGAASGPGVLAYSMYLTAIVPTNGTTAPTSSPTATANHTASPSPTAAPDPLLDEAKKHATATDCYVVYNNGTGKHLYNVTGYVRLHPGTPDSLVSGCGTDITDRYNNGDPNYKEVDTGLPHKHTKASNDILDLFKLP